MKVSLLLNADYSQKGLLIKILNTNGDLSHVFLDCKFFLTAWAIVFCHSASKIAAFNKCIYVKKLHFLPLEWNVCFDGLILPREHDIVFMRSLSMTGRTSSTITSNVYKVFNWEPFNSCLFQTIFKWKLLCSIQFFISIFLTLWQKVSTLWQKVSFTTRLESAHWSSDVKLELY